MAIREIAQELYKVTQKINALKAQIEQADEREKSRLKAELAQLEKEKTSLQRKLDSLKKKPLPI